MKNPSAPPYSQPVAPEFSLHQCLTLVTPTGYQVLEHLAAVAVRQRAEARAAKKGWQGGWTHVRTNQHVKLATLRALIRLGLATPCCSGHNGTDTVRITKKGVELLELVRGETILA